MDLPISGICSFAKQPICTDLDQLDADVAVLGAPLDMGTMYRSGARFGPRAIREASTLYAFGPEGAYSPEDDQYHLSRESVRIVDAGDADIIHTDVAGSFANIEKAVRKILARGALPVVLGGDHSVHIPCIRAFSDQPPVHVVQVDAHLDFGKDQEGVTFGHNQPLRRTSELSHVTGMTQIGIRNFTFSGRGSYEEARAAGSEIVTMRRARELGMAGVLQLIPKGRRYYCTIDIDGLDPAVAPGTGSPSPGGFLYDEVIDLLRGLARRGQVVGVDLVEVAPPYDATGATSLLAAQLLLRFLGYVFVEKGGI
ncbi:MAG: agmatinase [Rhodospirillaceae bacterium]|nr:agmatinase [Rhodospirillaceae bacterium]